MQSRWECITDFLQNKKNILITTHLNPDGDALGSEISLAHYLKQIGTSFRIINADLTPAYFNFLNSDRLIEQYHPDRHAESLALFDGCIVVDVGEYARLGGMCDIVKSGSFPVAFIDHHISTVKIGDAQVVDEHCSSTGELIYDFLKESGANFTQEIVDALYTCILTDTGSFRFSNTTSQTHHITADLMQKNARFGYIYSELYESDSKNRSLLKGQLLANMHFEYQDKFAWFVLSQDILKQTKTKIWESEGFSELPRSVKSVEISIMFTETIDGLAKASFRSKGNIPINDLAEQFGGGGHKFAAGAALTVPLAEAIPALRKAAKKHLEKYNCLSD
jgi:bifunctional oligoribonuclease and PAP phosphatase NrnA